VTQGFRLLPLLATSLALALSASATNWPQWRGPFFNGSSTETGLPSQWTKTENIAWAAPMPGPSGATPIIWEDRIFVSSLDKETKDLVALCLNRKDGSVRWSKILGIGFSDEGRGRNLASPSPVTDGKRVFFLFGSSDFAALDLEGNLLWSRNLQEDFGDFNILFGYHCSPLLHNGKLYVQVLQRDHPIEGPVTGTEKPTDSFLLAIDPLTGKDLWKHIRPTDAVEEAHESYATPMPFEHGGRSEILLVGGDCASGHDPETGKEWWRWGSWNPQKNDHWRVVPTLVTGPGLIYVSTPKGSPVYAIKAGGNGQLNDEAISWQLDKNTTDCSVPLLYNGRLYVLDGDKKVLTSLDCQTGEVKWAGKVGGTAFFRASPTGADGKIYLISEEGEVVIAEAGEAYKEIARIPMGEGACQSSIVAAQGQVFIRTAENLYCVGKP
jgi:outer membrane protein assembly factor BamB